MTRRLTVRVADLFAASPELVEEALRRQLRPAMSSHVAGTGAGTVVTLETSVPALTLGRRGRAIVDLDAVLTAVHNELDTAMAASQGGRTVPLK